MCASAFNSMTSIRGRHSSALRMATFSEPGQDPLLLRAARGEEVERVPVWMMRQAGRHMQSYRDVSLDI